MTLLQYYNLLFIHIDKGYTFFAPTNWAFVRMMPQDIADPFYVDTELRTTVLLHHFVRQKLSADDLLKTTELMMADKKPSNLTRSSSPSKPFTSLFNLTSYLVLEILIVVTCTDGVQINKAKVNLDPIHFGSNTGVIYIVDKVFTTHEEISKAIERNPASETPWGPIHPQSNPANNGDNVESQTVVVDLVAELLRDEATGQH